MSIISRGAVTYYRRPSWINDVDMEIIDPMKPARWRHEFMGRTLNLLRWHLRDTGAATEGLINHANGQGLELALTNANEIQLACVDQQDRDSSRVALNPVFEAKMMFSVLPTAGTTAFIGFAENHNADPDAIAESAWFRWDDDGAVTVETDDGTPGHETSKVATGITVLANEWHVYRICMTHLEDICFFIDGHKVAVSTTFDMSDAAGGKQHYLRIGKEAPAVSVGTMVVDYLQISQERG